jgi:hypothetical protein
LPFRTFRARRAVSRAGWSRRDGPPLWRTPAGRCGSVRLTFPASLCPIECYRGQRP